MSDNRWAQARLVREHAARHTLLDDRSEGITQYTAAYSIEAERLWKDHAEGLRDIIIVSAYSYKREDDEQQWHERNEHRRHLTDTLDAADDDDSSDHRYYTAYYQLNCLGVSSDTRSSLKSLRQGTGYLVCLHTAHTYRGKHTEQRRDIRQPLPL